MENSIIYAVSYIDILKEFYSNQVLLNLQKVQQNSAGIHLFKVNNRNIRTMPEIYLTLTVKTPGWRQWHCSGVFYVNFE